MRIVKVDENGDLLEAKILKKLSHPAIVDLKEVLDMPGFCHSIQKIFTENISSKLCHNNNHDQTINHILTLGVQQPSFNFLSVVQQPLLLLASDGFLSWRTTLDSCSLQPRRASRANILRSIQTGHKDNHSI